MSLLRWIRDVWNQGVAVRGQFSLGPSTPEAKRAELDSELRVQAWVDYRKRLPCPKCGGIGTEEVSDNDVVRCSYCKGLCVDLRRLIREA